MINKHIIIATIIFMCMVFWEGAATIVPSLSFNGVAHAQVFTKESFQGTYASRSIGGANDNAVIGMVTSDGNGNFTGSGIYNSPAPFGKRRVIPITFTGTYNVNEDGTATCIFTFTTTDGLSTEVNVDWIVMQAEVIDGVKMATEIYGLGREGQTLLEGKLGGLTIFHAKRLPD
jgi:hypothetical protein